MGIVGRIVRPLALPVVLIGVLAAVSFAIREGADRPPPIQVTGVGFTTATGARHDGALARSNRVDSDADRGLRVLAAPVRGLRPGDRPRLQLRFRNPLGFALAVRTVRTTAAGPRSCAANRALVLGRQRLAHRVVVPAHGSGAGWVPFGMRPSAPPACVRAAFTVKVIVIAVRLSR